MSTTLHIQPLTLIIKQLFQKWNVSKVQEEVASYVNHTTLLVRNNELLMGPSRGRGGWGGRNGVYLFLCSPDILAFPLFPKIKILIFLFPAPQNYLCSPVPFIFRRFHCSPEMNDIIPLFPRTPGRASLIRTPEPAFPA